MAFDPIQEDCLRLTLEAMRREHIYPLEDAAFAEQCAEGVSAATRRASSCTTATAPSTSWRLPPEAIDYPHSLYRRRRRGRAPGPPKPSTSSRRPSTSSRATGTRRRMLAALVGDLQRRVCNLSGRPPRRGRVGHRGARPPTRHDPYSREYAIGLRPAPLPALARRARLARAHRRQVPPGAPGRRGLPRRRARRPGRSCATPACSPSPSSRPRARSSPAGAAPTATAYLPPIPFRRRHHTTEKTPDAWTLLAELAAAYHELDFTGATRALRSPHARLSRARPSRSTTRAGGFPRGSLPAWHVLPQSEDELILALSEATPLLQEGIGSPESACLASWIATNPLVTGRTRAARRAVRRHRAPPAAGRGALMEAARLPLCLSGGAVSERARRAHACRARARAQRRAHPAREVRPDRPCAGTPCLHACA